MIRRTQEINCLALYSFSVLKIRANSVNSFNGSRATAHLPKFLDLQSR